MEDPERGIPRPTPRRGLSQVLNPRPIQSGTLISFPLLQGNLIKAGTNQTLSCFIIINVYFQEVAEDKYSVEFLKTLLGKENSCLYRNKYDVSRIEFTQ